MSEQPLTILPVVMAGGSGTRLWPLSREKYPKQLLPLIGEDSLLQATVRHYVDTTEPVGSKTLVQRFGLEVSPATIRSANSSSSRVVMAEPRAPAAPATRIAI